MEWFRGQRVLLSRVTTLLLVAAEPQGVRAACCARCATARRAADWPVDWARAAGVAAATSALLVANGAGSGTRPAAAAAAAWSAIRAGRRGQHRILRRARPRRCESGTSWSPTAVEAAGRRLRGRRCRGAGRAARSGRGLVSHRPRGADRRGESAVCARTGAGAVEMEAAGVAGEACSAAACRSIACAP